jgi:hypothetical protein
MTRENFIKHVTRDVGARRRKEAARQAEEVWRRALDATSAPAPEEGANDIAEPDE